MHSRMSVEEFKNFMHTFKIPKPCKIRKDKWISYHDIYCGFDIETSSIDDKSFMYIWQFSFLSVNCEQIVIKGRKWSEFLDLCNFLKKILTLRETTRLIVWVANLSYEFQFIRKKFTFDEVFAKSARQPLIARTGGLEFRESLTISQGNLAFLAKTYCTTQKLIGDLDYSIVRNSKTPLTEEEECYCDNDVIILSEFSKYIFDNYIKKEKYIPLTSTGILRHDMKKECKETDDIKKVYHYIQSLYPRTKADYLYIFKYLFRGGFVHSNFSKTGFTIENMVSYDKKSSYPASAFQEYYPISQFERVYSPSWKRLIELSSKYCIITKITFTNITSKTPHSIESKSKAITLKEPFLDNGRIHNAQELTVMLTELDLYNYMDFYNWDNAEVHYIEIAKRGNLPKYLINSFYKWYYLKETTDKENNKQLYDIIKTRVNGNFGMCVTRLVFNEISYNDNEWTEKATEREYADMISEQILSPFWGIWICAHSRRSELETLKAISSYVVYSDTDSHKSISCKEVDSFFTEYNKTIEEKTIKACERYNLDFLILQNIGKFQKEYDIQKFKTLGAKKYLTMHNDFIESTISGVRKGSVSDYCKAFKIDEFEFFNENMKIPPEYTKKLTPIYTDESYSEEVTDLQGNTEIMSEESGVFLKNVTFNISFDKDYLALLLYNMERMKKHG